MSEKIDKLRIWLERNKIFFDIITAFFLTMMTITVSISANQIAKNQNDLMKEENQPIFRFNLTESHNDNNDNNNFPETVETLRIYNDGKPIYKFSAEPYGFLQITYAYNNNATKNYYNFKDETRKNTYVIVTNFFCGIPIYTTSSTGLLATLSRPSFSNIKARGVPYDEVEMIKDAYNSSYIAMLLMSNTSTTLEIINEDLLSYSKKQSNYTAFYSESGFVDLYTYVHITYIDIYGEKHDEIYWVNKWGSSKLFEKDKTIVERNYMNKQMNYNSIDDFMYISPTKIIKLLSESPSVDYDLPGPSWQISHKDL